MIANVRTTKARLSELLERAAAGEDIVITSDGRPKAKLVGIPPVRATYRVNRRLLLIFPDGEPRCLDAIATRVCLGDSQRTPR